MNRGLGPIAALLACALYQPAHAQDDDSAFTRQRNESVRERSRPEYEAMGKRLGGFMLFPRVTAGVVYDDNIFALSSNEISDTIFTVAPSVQLVSQWGRHALGASANLYHSEYADNSSENSTSYSVDANGRLDVSRDTTVSGSARYGRVVESRTALEAFQNTREPIRYDQVDLTAAATHRFNRIRLNFDLANSNYSYDDTTSIAGLPISQKFRDVSITTATGRIDYTISPDTFLFVKASYNKHDFDLEPPAVTASRDSDGYEFTAGADFDLTNLLRGQVEAGWLRQEFDSAAFASFSGAQVRGRVEYFPTQLTTVTLLGSRSVQDSSNPATPGYLSTAVGLQVDHELLRNVILTARGDYERAKYTGIDRHDNRYFLSIGGTYLMNRHVGLSVTYSHLDQQSSGIDRGFGFQDNRFMASTTLQY